MHSEVEERGRWRLVQNQTISLDFGRLSYGRFPLIKENYNHTFVQIHSRVLCVFRLKRKLKKQKAFVSWQGFLSLLKGGRLQP